jgi:hypothetical protein
MAAQVDAVEVRGEHPPPVRVGQLLEGEVGIDARVVDEDVDLAGLGEDRLHASADLGLVRDVDRLRERLPAEPLDGRRESFAVPVEERDPGPFRRQTACGREAEASRRPRDDGGLAHESLGGSAHSRAGTARLVHGLPRACNPPRRGLILANCILNTRAPPTQTLTGRTSLRRDGQKEGTWLRRHLR